MMEHGHHEDDEHTGEPRGQIGPLVQIVGHETGGSDWFAVNQQNKALWRPRTGDRCFSVRLAPFCSAPANILTHEPVMM
jgi:hypothetical protein